MAGSIVSTLSGRDSTRRNRQAEEDPWPEEDGGEGGAGGEGGDEQCAPRRRRLHMEQVARGSAEAVTDEEQGTRRAPTYIERDRRTGVLALIEYIWPLSDSEEHRLQGVNATQQWETVGPGHAQQAGLPS